MIKKGGDYVLSFDDNMFRLAKMQETLLKVSTLNREENLRKYQEFVTQIDVKAFAELLDEIKHIDEHNHSLEEELQFLEAIEKSYNQISELQSGFKSVCEQYGDVDFHLSDLSKLNIEYIRERINAINDYLITLKNIEKNKVRIDKLTEQLVEHEKKKDFVSKRLFELETKLRESFMNSEGRLIINGRLIPTSVVNEYRKLDFDFEKLLNDANFLENVLGKCLKDKNDALETLKTAEICYNNVLTDESKKFLEDAKNEYLKMEYKLTMLKIAKLLAHNYTDCDDAMNKREDLLELVEYRFSCLKCMGIVSAKDKDLDPFYRVKIKEQLEVIENLSSSIKGNKNIYSELSDLQSLTEEMIRQKPLKQITLTNTKSLVKDSMSFKDIDISDISLPVETEVVKEILPNQVVSVRVASSKLNMSIISQKTNGVIVRVNKMVNRSRVAKDSSKIPQLVIVPSQDNVFDDTLEVEKYSDLIEQINDVDSFDGFDIDLGEKVSSDVSLADKALETDSFKLVVDTIDDGLFDTVNPFSEPVMFDDRTDESVVSESFEAIDFPIIDEDNSSFENVNSVDDDDNFWISQSETETFSDEQIGEILSLNKTEDTKVRRKAA